MLNIFTGSDKHIYRAINLLLENGFIENYGGIQFGTEYYGASRGSGR